MRADLNERERRWHLAWKGHIAVVHDSDEALAAIGLEITKGV